VAHLVTKTPAWKQLTVEGLVNNADLLAANPGCREASG
jgi:hypothetical protein